MNILAALTAQLILLAAFSSSAAEVQTIHSGEHAVKAVFVNEDARQSIDLYWVNHAAEPNDPDRLRFEATIPPRGGGHHSDTYELHEFAYQYYGIWHYVKIDEPNLNHETLIVLAGNSEMPSGEPRGILVRCEVSLYSESIIKPLDIMVMPYWAPRGAVRFLELVRMGYYDGVALHRVVPNFLTQFGIARDYNVRTDVSDVRIWDDFKRDIPFKPGTVSFAGSESDSRTSEIFIVMPGASEDQLNEWGKNAWETPFGFVEGDLAKGALSQIYSGYGDMPPEGTGPDPNKIYAEDGYEYLSSNYPLLDFINQCYVLEEKHLPPDEL